MKKTELEKLLFEAAKNPVGAGAPVGAEAPAEPTQTDNLGLEEAKQKMEEIQDEKNEPIEVLRDQLDAVALSLGTIMSVIEALAQRISMLEQSIQPTQPTENMENTQEENKEK